MVTEQQEKYIAGFFSFGHRTMIGAGTSTYLPGTGETTEVAIIIPRTGTLRNLSWDCQSNGLTGANNRFTVRVGALHASPNASAPALTDALVVSLDDGITSGTGLPMNVSVAAGQRVAVFVQAKGGTNISRLRVSFELEAERPSAVWQPGDLVTSMPMPAGISAISINDGGLPEGEYYFRVAASDGTDWTRASAQLCWKLKKTPGEKYGIRVSWNPVFRASKYRLYRALTIDGEYNYIETSDTWYDYLVDSAFTGTGSPPEVTTAYINKLAADGVSWLMGGNIGIGTVNPQAKLDVQGTIKITDGSEGPGKVLTSDTKGNATWTALPTLGQTLRHDGISWHTDQTPNTPAGGNNYVIYSNSTACSYFEGNVGIGTSIPQAKLDVKGDLRLQTGVAVNEFSTDAALSGNSDLAVPTEKSVKTYVDAATSGVIPKGCFILGDNPAPPPGYSYTGLFIPISQAIPQTTLPDMSVARSHFAADILKGKLYAIGGVLLNGERTDLNEEYDPVANKWTIRAKLSTPRHSHVVAVVKDKLYAIGGSGSPGIIYNIEEYDPVTDRWFQKSKMPEPGNGLAVGVVKDKIYVFGGAYDHTVTQEYDPATDKWSKKASMPTPRHGHAASVVNDKVYVFGGNMNNGSLTNRVEEYDPLMDKWSNKAGMPAVRDGHEACVINGKIYIIGGSANGPGIEGVVDMNTIEEYNPATDRWTNRGSMPGSRINFAAGVFNDCIYIIGGIVFAGYVRKKTIEAIPLQTLMYIHVKT